MRAKGAFLGLFGLISVGFIARAQTHQAQRPDGSVAYTLTQADSLKILPGGLLITFEHGLIRLRDARNGEIEADSLAALPVKTSFGFRARLQNGRQIAVLPGNPIRTLLGTGLQDLGMGWFRLQQGNSLTVLSGRIEPNQAIKDIDSAKVLADDKLVFFRKKRAGLCLLQADGTVVQTLPPVYDSIACQKGRYVLAYDKGKVYLFHQTGRVVYAGAFTKAHFLNSDWLAGLTGKGWNAVHLPSLQVYPTSQPAQAAGAKACAFQTKTGLTVLDSTGKVVGQNLQASLAQESTERLLVQRSSKWFLLSEKGQASIHLKTPTVARLRPYTEGLAALESAHELWGFVDPHGFMRVAPRYNQVSDFAIGLAGVKIGMGWGLIDKAERIVAQPIYDTVFALPGLGVWLARGKRETSVYTDKGSVATYLEAAPCGNLLRIRESSGWGLATSGGKLIFPTWYAELKPAGPGRFIARRGLEWAVLAEDHSAVLPWGLRSISYDVVSGLFFVTLNPSRPTTD